MKIEMNNKCRNELISALGNENQFRNENQFGNELEMNRRNDVEMNRRNETEMNAGNELEMNQRLEMNNGLEMNRKTINNKNNGADNMNQKTTRKSTTDETKKIKKKTNKKTIKGDGIMNIVELDKVKAEVQKGFTGYISPIKFVTYENARVVLKTIKKDLMIYKNTDLFIVRGNMIDIRLRNNATLCTYYFLNKDVMAEVVEKLSEFGIEVRKI